MDEFNKIQLVWRKEGGFERHSVGVLEKTPTGSVIFCYNNDAFKLRKEQGFSPYTEFGELNKIYTENVAEIFGQRLIKTDRPDVANFFHFWEVDSEKSADKFYLLGKTQGLVPTDIFEFLAEYKLTSETHFLTEVVGQSFLNIESGKVLVNDCLTVELDPNNEHDPYAVKVFKGELLLGYIKKYHSKIFYEPGADKLKLCVKALEQNGIIKRIFVKVFV
jgi:hypothetical protein